MNLFAMDESEERQASTGVKLVAVGGCGLALLERLAQAGLRESESTVAVDSDKPRLADVEADERLLLGEQLTEGYGTGGDDRIGLRCLSGRHQEARELLMGSSTNILIGGLGGGTATALLPELAKISRSLGALTLVVSTRPFRYEGHGKTVLAKRRIHSLVRSADSVFLIHNDAVSGAEAAKLSASEALRRSDSAVTSCVEGILQFVRPGKRTLLDFGTIKSYLTRGGLSAFAGGVSAMRNNAIEAFKAAMSQFAKGKSDVTKSPRALIQFAIDDDVLLDGVRNAFGVAQRVFSKDAQLAMGVVFNEVKEGKTSVSLIASGLPLFNEVVELDFVQRRLESIEVESDRLRRPPTIRTGRILAGSPEALRILNPRRPSEDELKIPAYLRRRMEARIKTGRS